MALFALEYTQFIVRVEFGFLRLIIETFFVTGFAVAGKIPIIVTNGYFFLAVLKFTRLDIFRSAFLAPTKWVEAPSRLTLCAAIGHAVLEGTIFTLLIRALAALTYSLIGPESIARLTYFTYLTIVRCPIASIFDIFRWWTAYKFSYASITLLWISKPPPATHTKPKIVGVTRKAKGVLTGCHNIGIRVR